jgi:hypothetical protein
MSKVRCGLPFFQVGSMSMSSAAHVAGMLLPYFVTILMYLKISVVNGNGAVLEDNLAMARQWCGQPQPSCRS